MSREIEPLFGYNGKWSGAASTAPTVAHTSMEGVNMTDCTQFPLVHGRSS